MANYAGWLSWIKTAKSEGFGRKVVTDGDSKAPNLELGTGKPGWGELFNEQEIKRQQG